MFTLQKSAVLAVSGALAVSTVALAAYASDPPATTSTDFSRALQSNYGTLATEEGQQRDVSDDTHYAGKASVSGAGGQVWPDVAGSRKMRVFSEGVFWTGDAPQVAAADAELASARQDLMNKHGAGFAGSHPAELARAQAQWDCWYEQQEEGYQLIHIARCRDGYRAAMAAMEPPVPAPATAYTPAAPGEVLQTINFAFDSNELDYRSRNTLDEVTADVARRG
ncbi:MAG: hypothetical protein RIC82_09785, partial [Parvibaculum sp.]